MSQSPSAHRPALLALALAAAACGGEASLPARGLWPLLADGTLAHTPEREAELAAADPGGAARAERGGFHDFGLVPLGVVAEHTYALANTDPRPVVLRKLDPSCGCTLASVSAVGADGERVQGTPGRSGEIVTVPAGGRLEIGIALDTRGVAERNVDKHFSVRLTSDSLARPFTTLEGHVIVDAPFQATPASIDLGRVPRGASATAKSTVVCVSALGGRITELRELPAGVEATLTEIEQLGRPTWVLEAGFAPTLELGRRAAKLLLGAARADGTPLAPLEIQLAATFVPEIECVPPQLVMHARGAEGGSASVQLVARLPGLRLRVLAAHLEGAANSGYAVAFAPLGADAAGRAAEWQLTLTAPPGAAAGAAAGTCVVELDDAQYPRLEIPYVANVF
jgi:hypothetical protein